MACGNGLQQASHLITQVGHQKNRTPMETFPLFWNFPPGWKSWDDRPDTKVCFICEYIIYEVPMPVGSCAVFPLLY